MNTKPAVTYTPTASGFFKATVYDWDKAILEAKLAAVTAERDALAEELQHYRDQGLITPREPQ